MRKEFRRWIVVAVVFIITSLAVPYGWRVWRLARAAHSAELAFEGAAHLNILLIGRDIDYDRNDQQVQSFARSDTIMVLGMDRVHHTVSLLSIPRDTLVKIPGQKTTKINAVHASGGHLLLKRVIENSLGLAIDHYMAVDMEGFEKAVDAVGGIEIDVEKDMSYDAISGNTHIHLKKGKQRLSGRQALQYVRYRSDDRYDIGRMERQQKLIKAFIQRCCSLRLRKSSPLAKALSECVETDLTLEQLLSVRAFVGAMGVDRIETMVLPGISYFNFWIPDRDQGSALLSRLFKESFHQGRWEANFWRAE